jgi:ribonuclease HI/predicted HAD superfamily Cof-like phosphohydrolase
MARRFIIQADGGSRGNPGPAAYGVIVRDAATGEVIAERGEHLGVATNNVAEYRGLIAGLQLVRELDPQASVDVQLDSRLVVEQMRGSWRIKHPDLVPLARRARELLPAGGARWTWVPRERNQEADRLVNEALDAVAGNQTVPKAAPPRPSPPAGASATVASSPPPASTPPASPRTAPPPPGTSLPGSPGVLVAQFHEAFGLPRQTRPEAGAVPADLARTRQRLLEEEVAELREAVEAQDVVGIARELADVVYVAYGTALTYGIDLDAVIAEVHRANMTKRAPDGSSARRADGKVLKGAGFQPPNVARVLGLGDRSGPPGPSGHSSAPQAL